MLSWFTTPTTSFNVFHRCCPWRRIITNETPWDLDYLPKEKKIMGKLGFFVVGNSKGKFGKDGGREVCTHVAWYRKATGADLGQGQDDHWETKQDCVHRACQFTEASTAGRLPRGSSHDARVLWFPTHFFSLTPRNVGISIAFFIDHHCN